MYFLQGFDEEHFLFKPQQYLRIFTIVFLPFICVQNINIMTSVTKALPKWHYIMLCNFITEIFTGIHLAWSLNWRTEGRCKSYNLQNMFISDKL